MNCVGKKGPKTEEEEGAHFCIAPLAVRTQAGSSVNAGVLLCGPCDKATLSLGAWTLAAAHLLT